MTVAQAPRWHNSLPLGSRFSSCSNEYPSGMVLHAQEVHVPDLVGQVEQDLKADGRALWVLGTSYKLCGLERIIGRLVPGISHAHLSPSVLDLPDG